MERDFLGIVSVRSNWLDCVQPELILKVVCCSYLWRSVWLIVTISSRRSWLHVENQKITNLHVSDLLMHYLSYPMSLSYNVSFTGFVGSIFWATGMPIGIEILQKYWRKVLEVSWNQNFRCFFKVFFSRAVFSITISQIVLIQCWLYALRGAKCNEHLFQQFSTFSCRKRWKVCLEIFGILKKKLTCFPSKTFS